MFGLPPRQGWGSRGEETALTAPKYSEKLDHSTRSKCSKEPIEGQYSGHARELVNRFIARLVDRTLEREHR